MSARSIDRLDPWAPLSLSLRTAPCAQAALQHGCQSMLPSLAQLGFNKQAALCAQAALQDACQGMLRIRTWC